MCARHVISFTVCNCSRLTPVVIEIQRTLVPHKILHSPIIALRRHGKDAGDRRTFTAVSYGQSIGSDRICKNVKLFLAKLPATISIPHTNWGKCKVG